MSLSVIIVGAGPGGLALALTLAQFGIQPLLIEKEIERSPFTKALTLQPRTLEVIDSLQLLDQFIARGNQIRKTEFFANGSSVGSIHYGDLPSTCGFLLSITQPESETVMEEALQKKGISIQRGLTCIDMRFEEGKGVVKVKHLASGKEEELIADYVVAADGGKSLLRSLFLERKKIQLTHETRYDSNFIMGDFEMEHYPFPRDERKTYFKNKTIFGLIPMVYPYVRIVAFGLKEAQDLMPKPEEFLTMTKAISGLDLDLSRGQWLSRFYPSRFMLDKFRIGPLFFIGDAAHIISPIGAQGINLSIEDGYNLGWKLGMVISKCLDPAILDSYQTERMAAAKVVLEETNALHHRLASPIRNFFFMQQLKFLKKPEIAQFVLLKQTQFYIDYPSDPASAKNRKKLDQFYAGQRFINARCLSPSGSHLFDHFSKDKWTVLINLDSGEAPLEEKIDDSLSNICCFFSISASSNAHLTIESDTMFYKRLKQSPLILLISPDKYVYRAYTRDSWKEGAAFLQSLFCEEPLPSRTL